MLRYLDTCATSKARPRLFLFSFSPLTPQFMSHRDRVPDTQRRQDPSTKCHGFSLRPSRTSPGLGLVGEAHVHLDTLRSLMPSPSRQLALVVQLGVRDIARIPAAILFVPEHGGPKALHVVAGLGIDALHFP